MTDWNELPLEDVLIYRLSISCSLLPPLFASCLHAATAPVLPDFLQGPPQSPKRPPPTCKAMRSDSLVFFILCFEKPSWCPALGSADVACRQAPGPSATSQSARPSVLPLGFPHPACLPFTEPGLPKDRGGIFYPAVPPHHHAPPTLGTG